MGKYSHVIILMLYISNTKISLFLMSLDLFESINEDITAIQVDWINFERIFHGLAILRH